MNTVTMMDVQALQKRIDRLEANMETKVAPKLTIVPSKAKPVKATSDVSAETNGFNIIIDVSDVYERSFVYDFIEEFDDKIEFLDQHHCTFIAPFDNEVDCKSAGVKVRHFFNDNDKIVHIHYIETESSIEETDENVSEFVRDHKAEWVENGEFYREQREAMGLSKTAMSKLIGCSRSSITSFENGDPMRICSMVEHGYDLVIALHRHNVPLDNIFASADDPWGVANE